MTGRIEVQGDLREEISRLREAVQALSGELASAWTRIEELGQAIEAHRENEPHLHADGSSS